MECKFQRRIAVLVGALVFGVVPGAAAGLPLGFSETEVARGISLATAMTFAPDGRIFVCEQTGQLRVIKNGALLAAPFLTVSVDSAGERGLLGVAVDPNFAVNQWVYVYYTVSTTPKHNRISRFTANGDVAAPGSERVIFELDELSIFQNHNGGAIHFGPDGKLYAAVGENNIPSHAQTLANLHGKMLRINTNGSIPPDNPFFHAASGANRAIWALGLRNPFTFAFQPGTGRMFINDVGQNAWEEINDGIAGSNYGWPATEGNTTNPQYRAPLLAYGHGNSLSQGCAITGGAFYNPAVTQYPGENVGRYFFADLCSGWIRRFDPATLTSDIFAVGISFPVDIKLGTDGMLYYLARGTGSVHRITYVPGYRTPTAVFRDVTGGVVLDAFASFMLRSAGGAFAGDPGGAQNAAGDTIAAVRDALGAISANVYSAASQTWGTWVNGGGVTKGVPAVAVPASGTGYIAVRDTFDSFWLTSYTPGIGFGSWTYLAGIFSEDPAMTACADGSLYIVGTDAFKSLWSGRFIPGVGPGTGFQGWIFGGGILEGKPSVTCGTDNVAYVAIRDSWNSLWIARVGSGGWLGWSYGGGIMSGDPQVAASGTGTIYVALRDVGNGVWYRGYTEGTSSGWQTWTFTGGVLASLAPSAVNGELFITGRDASNSLWWYRTVGNQWTAIGATGVVVGGFSAAPR